MKERLLPLQPAPSQAQGVRLTVQGGIKRCNTSHWFSTIRKKIGRHEVRINCLTAEALSWNFISSHVLPTRCGHLSTTKEPTVLYWCCCDMGYCRYHSRGKHRWGCHRCWIVCCHTFIKFKLQRTQKWNRNVFSISTICTFLT